MLVAALRQKRRHARIFAWGGSETNGSLFFVDGRKRLREATFTKTTVGYEVWLSEEEGLDEDDAFTTMIDQRELASLGQYIPENEFPAKVNIIEAGPCRAHVVLLWRANLRSFSGNPDDAAFDIVWPALRVIVSRGETVVSNLTHDLSQFFPTHPEKVFTEDMNGDGVKDYVFIGGYQSDDINIWTLSASCVFQPLAFVEGETNQRTESLNGRSIDVRKVRSGGYSIRVRNRTPFETYTEIYQWAQSAGAFVMTRRVEEPQAR
jgi:hypothetical protein